jgi:hypothetical protein
MLDEKNHTQIPERILRIDMESPPTFPEAKPHGLEALENSQCGFRGVFWVEFYVKLCYEK